MSACGWGLPVATILELHFELDGLAGSGMTWSNHQIQAHLDPRESAAEYLPDPDRIVSVGGVGVGISMCEPDCDIVVGINRNAGRISPWQGGILSNPTKGVRLFASFEQAAGADVWF